MAHGFKNEFGAYLFGMIHASTGALFLLLFTVNDYSDPGGELIRPLNARIWAIVLVLAIAFLFFVIHRYYLTAGFVRYTYEVLPNVSDGPDWRVVVDGETVERYDKKRDAVKRLAEMTQPNRTIKSDRAE